MDELLLIKMRCRLLDRALDAFNVWWEYRGWPCEAEKKAQLTTASNTWKQFKKLHKEGLE